MTSEDQMDEGSQNQGRPIIGGQHGSPTITVAFPFSHVRTDDSGLRDAVAELAELVGRLAKDDVGDENRAALGHAALEMAARLREEH